MKMRRYKGATQEGGVSGATETSTGYIEEHWQFIDWRCAPSV